MRHKDIQKEMPEGSRSENRKMCEKQAQINILGNYHERCYD